MKCCEVDSELRPRRRHMADFRLLAGRNLLCVDLGRRYCGLAVRTSSLLGAQPYGLLEAAAGGGAARCGRWRHAPFSGGAPRPRASKRSATRWRPCCASRRSAASCSACRTTPTAAARRAAAAERHAAELQAAWRGVPIVLWDESWSTRAAAGPRRRPKAGGGGGRRRGDAAWTHSAAACVVLADVLRALQPHEAPA